MRQNFYLNAFTNIASKIIDAFFSLITWKASTICFIIIFSSTTILKAAFMFSCRPFSFLLCNFKPTFFYEKSLGSLIMKKKLFYWTTST